jgi:dienelactone hydrolase
MRDWSVPARTYFIAVLVAALTIGAWAWPAVEAYGRAAALFGDAVLRLPVRPLTWVTPDPVTEELRWPDGGYGLLTRPGDEGRHAALVVVLGADPASPDDPRVRRLTDSLARTGFAVLLARSEALIDGRVSADEVPLAAGAFQVLRDHPSVRPDRVAFVGLSTGGSVALVAAADPSIAADVWFVLAIGPYYDAGALAAEVTSETYAGTAGQVAWDPDETAVEVVRATLLAQLDDADRAAIEAGTAPVSADGRAIARLLARPGLAEAESLVASLGPAAQATLDAVSPSRHLAGLRAPLYLLHDRDDPFIPWTHSESIAAAYEPDVYHRLELFDHVDPAPGNVGVLLRDGWRLLRLFAAIIRDS